MSANCRLVSIDGLTKNVFMPRVDPYIRVAWADVPKIYSKHDDAMVMNNINIRTYEYDKTETIHIYKEKP